MMVKARQKTNLAIFPLCRIIQRLIVAVQDKNNTTRQCCCCRDAKVYR